MIAYNDPIVIENRLAMRAVNQIAVEAAREASPELTVAGVVPVAGGTSYVEILIKAEGWDATLGVFRNTGPVALKKTISDHLQRHLDEHRAI